MKLPRPSLYTCTYTHVRYTCSQEKRAGGQCQARAHNSYILAAVFNLSHKVGGSFQPLCHKVLSVCNLSVTRSSLRWLYVCASAAVESGAMQHLS